MTFLHPFGKRFFFFLLILKMKLFFFNEKENFSFPIIGRLQGKIARCRRNKYPGTHPMSCRWGKYVGSDLFRLVFLKKEIENGKCSWHQ